MKSSTISEITQVRSSLLSIPYSLHFHLVPVYILSVVSVILVICFIHFFRCEYRRQRKDNIEHQVTNEGGGIIINNIPESA